MTTKAQHIKAIEAAMGMTFNKLNKLRTKAMAAKKARNNAEYTVARAQIDLAHQAMLAYYTEHKLNPYTMKRDEKAYA